MTARQRAKLTGFIQELVEEHGPWAVLWEFTQIMKQPFREQALLESAPKRNKKKNGETLEPPEFVNPMPFGD